MFNTYRIFRDSSDASYHVREVTSGDDGIQIRAGRIVLGPYPSVDSLIADLAVMMADITRHKDDTINCPEKPKSTESGQVGGI